MSKDERLCTDHCIHYSRRNADWCCTHECADVRILNRRRRHRNTNLTRITEILLSCDFFRLHESVTSLIGACCARCVRVSMLCVTKHCRMEKMPDADGNRWRENWISATVNRVAPEKKFKTSAHHFIKMNIAQFIGKKRRLNLLFCHSIDGKMRRVTRKTHDTPQILSVSVYCNFYGVNKKKKWREERTKIRSSTVRKRVFGGRWLWWGFGCFLYFCFFIFNCLLSVWRRLPSLTVFNSVRHGEVVSSVPV